MPELARIEAVVILQGMDLLAHCKAEEILRIAAIAGERPFAAGETIYRPHEPAERFFCVVRGSVGLTAADGSSREVGPLQSFGVIEILSGRLRTEEATALQDTLTLACEADDIFDLLSNNIEVIKALFRYLLQRPASSVPAEVRHEALEPRAPS
jgi:CRP-like cAMP-binding protein